MNNRPLMRAERGSVPIMERLPRRLLEDAPLTASLAPQISFRGSARAVDAELTAAPILEARPTSCSHVRQIVKRGPVFAVGHTDGAIHPGCCCGQGIYSADTRHVSGSLWRLEEQVPVVLSSRTDEAGRSRTEVTFREFTTNEGVQLRADTIHATLIREAGNPVVERLRIVSFNREAVLVQLVWEVRADFKDMFEVRGFGDRNAPGTFLRTVVEGPVALFAYLGTDEVLRETAVRFAPEPRSVLGDRHLPTREAGTQATYALWLEPGAPREIEVAIALHEFEDIPVATPVVLPCDREFTRLASDDAAFDAFLSRGLKDLEDLVVPLPTGPYVAAGLPWYACPFGRDGLIAAYQALALDPELAGGTLRYLAERQGSRFDPSCDEAPGKILHESRRGELSRCGDMPFAPSYCTVDATPLFLVLLAEHHRWTGDDDLLDALWPHAMRALDWIDEETTEGGFLAYRRQGPGGLINQGWKDSWDAILHPDGTPAPAPIALVEVQGYVFDAWLKTAALARKRGEEALALRLEGQAADLQARFEAAFWSPELGTYALAIDGEGRPVLAASSNAGHCLWSGIVPPDRAPLLAAQLLSEPMFSGWGIRTLSTDSPNFNPISYHNGSVWPHDNSLVARGMTRYGLKTEAGRVLEALFDAATHFERLRLPELFCGFSRRESARPVPYPVACSPQAWAAGAPTLLLASVLGLIPDGPGETLAIDEPYLPAVAGEVELRGIRVGRGTADLAFSREGGRTRCSVLKTTGSLKIVVS